MTRYVALYCRISIDRSGRKEGVKTQETYGREYAAQTWPGVPVRVFSDNDLSAAKDDVVRPDYNELRQALERREVAHVWAIEQSRIERREVQWFEFAALMDGAGISELHTKRDGIVHVRTAVAGIKAVLNAEEVRVIKRRIQDKFDAKAARGEPPGGPSFGFRHATREDGVKTYAQHPEEANAIRRAADWVLSGWSLGNIAAQLKEQGFRGAKGGAVTVNTVRSMVTRPAVAGYLVRQGRVIGRGNWEPILTDDTWQACRLKLSEPRNVRKADGTEHKILNPKRSTAPGRKYLLTGGLAVCGVCGNPLSGTIHRVGKRGKIPYLLCHTTKGGRACTGIMLKESEEYVAERLFAELDKPEFLNAIGADEHGPRRMEIIDALDAIEKQRGELATLWAKPGELTFGEWQAARSALGEHEQMLRNELTELPPPVVNIDIEGAREAWPEMTLDEKREFLRLFIDKVVLHRARPGTRSFDGDRLDIKWRYT
ncbi:recombinase family protein [Lentzea sp. BCCO 10_0798]|uniref:Recombinase family protein n=1 Tax=Lentzea kristufekii TaxID=3095430 RepID=A0ABU4TUY8_9PSEU|nr:recombinase family protein [Lentzea sp. BCCO 10_0798]MDX8052005.1 recombinase family protein [Lentzea sp. BCCO 10_0798]